MDAEEWPGNDRSLVNLIVNPLAVGGSHHLGSLLLSALMSKWPASYWSTILGVSAAASLLHSLLLRRCALALQQLPVFSIEEARDELWRRRFTRDSPSWDSLLVQVRGVVRIRDENPVAVCESTHIHDLSSAGALDITADTTQLRHNFSARDFTLASPSAGTGACLHVKVRWQSHLQEIVSAGILHSRPSWRLLSSELLVGTTQGRLAIHEETKVGLIPGSIVTVLGRMELRVGWGEGAVAISRLRAAGRQLLNRAAGATGLGMLGDKSAEDGLDTLLASIPRCLCSLHLTSSQDDMVALLGETRPLLCTEGSGALLGHARRLYWRALGAWARAFTPGSLLVTERHPHEVSATLMRQGGECMGRAVRLAGLAALAGMVAALPCLMRSLAARRRSRQQQLLREQQQQQQRAQLEERARRAAHIADEEDQEEEEEEAWSQAACIICCDAARDVILLPCAHQVVCSACAAQLRGRTSRAYVCPVCRIPVASLLRVRPDAPPSLPPLREAARPQAYWFTNSAPPAGPRASLAPELESLQGGEGGGAAWPTAAAATGVHLALNQVGASF